MPIRTSRRTLLAAAAGGVLARPALAQPAARDKLDHIVVNASGGAMNNMFRKIYFPEFERRFGIRVVDTSPVDFGKLRAMVDSGNPEWTVTELGAQDGARAKQMNLLEPLDHSIVTLDGWPAEAHDSHVFWSSAYTTALGFRTDAFPNGTHPKGWAEFWDVKKFPGARSLRNHPVDNLEFALLADGVPMDKIYPIDMDRAFRKLDQIKPHIDVWWSTGAQPAQLLVDKEVVLATAWNGRLFELNRRGAPVGTEFQGGSLKPGTFGIPRGTPNAYWGQHFIAVMTEPKLQAQYAEALAYPGLNPKMIEFVAPELRPLMPTAPENLAKQFWLDQAWWTENGQKAQERWNRWMLQR